VLGFPGENTADGKMVLLHETGAVNLSAATR
jgi:hypothetical protein